MDDIEDDSELRRGRLGTAFWNLKDSDLKIQS